MKELFYELKEMAFQCSLYDLDYDSGDMLGLSPTDLGSDTGKVS